MEFLVLGALIDEYLVEHIEGSALVVSKFLSSVAFEHTADELASKVDEGDGVHASEMVVQVEAHLISGYHRRSIWQRGHSSIHLEKILQAHHVVVALTVVVFKDGATEGCLRGGCHTDDGADGTTLS